MSRAAARSRAGHHGQLALRRLAGHADALARQHLVAGAAQADHVHASRPGFRRRLLDLRRPRRLHDLGRQHRLVAVDDHVDALLLEHAEVRVHRGDLRRAQQDVLDLGGDERAAPAVGERAAHRLRDEREGIGVAAEARAMQDVHRLGIDAQPDLRTGRPGQPRSLSRRRS